MFDLAWSMWVMSWLLKSDSIYIVIGGLYITMHSYVACNGIWGTSGSNFASTVHPSVLPLSLDTGPRHRLRIWDICRTGPSITDVRKIIGLLDLLPLSAFGADIAIHVQGPKKWFAECDKHYPSRSGQTSLATAVANFIKQRTSHFFDLCIHEVLNPCYLSY